MEIFYQKLSVAHTAVTEESKFLAPETKVNVSENLFRKKAISKFNDFQVVIKITEMFIQSEIVITI